MADKVDKYLVTLTVSLEDLGDFLGSIVRDYPKVELLDIEKDM